MIKLNFLEITPQDFSFRVYRAPFDSSVISPSTFRYRLPIGTKQDAEYLDYCVSFEQIDGFERFECTNRTNIPLSVRYLYHTLYAALINVMSNLDASLQSKYSRRKLEFIIEITQYGEKRIILSPYFLKSKGTFGFLINYRFKKKPEVPFGREVQKLSLSLDSKYQSNKNYYSDKFRIIKSFLSDELLPSIKAIKKDFQFSINPGLTGLQESRLEKKEYRFKDGKKDFSQFQGIRKHGAFKEIQKRPNYAFIFEDKFRNFANDLFLSLMGKTNPGTFPGMTKMFGLAFDKYHTHQVRFNGYTTKCILSVIEELKRVKAEKPNEDLIGIFIEPTRDESIPAESSPYFILKYFSTINNIPIQVVSYDRMSKFNALKWSTSNIGLQIFAKLGGIPWKLKPTNDNCLILGIGSAHEKDQDGSFNKYFAYTVCLDSSGIYNRLEILSEDHDFGDYLSKLKKRLIEIINAESSAGYNKCALHLPFAIKGKEIYAIKDAISEISNIEFKVIKINTENDFFGFSDHNTLVPYESSYIKLAFNEYLVWFEGLNYGKENVFKQTGNPVHVKFLEDQEDTEENVIGYLQDVINLSGANWRGFNSKQIPISIYYAKILADYTKAFSHFDDFNPKMFQNTLPWFL